MNTPTKNLVCHDICSPIVHIKEGEFLRQVIVLEKTIPEITLIFSLDGINATLDCAIIILADDVSIPLDIKVIHNASHTNAKVLVRSVGRNKASIRINSILQALDGANESTTHFSHHALHLSDDVQTKTVPSLEIKAGRVDAKHEVSIGYFDQQAIWYGQTRGISKDEMINEMAKGFAIKDLCGLSSVGDISSAFESVETFMAHT